MIPVEPVLCLPIRSLEVKSNSSDEKYTRLALLSVTQVIILKRSLASRGMCVMLHYVTSWLLCFLSVLRLLYCDSVSCSHMHHAVIGSGMAWIIQ